MPFDKTALKQPYSSRSNFLIQAGKVRRIGRKRRIRLAGDVSNHSRFKCSSPKGQVEQKYYLIFFKFNILPFDEKLFL
jgi:hypothetical protein